MIKEISIDFDNVLYNLEGVNLAEVKRIYGKEISTEEIEYWDYYYDHYPEVTKIWKDLKKYSNGNFFEKDKEFIENLKQIGLNIQIVTASAAEIEKEKDQMIFERYGDIKVIHTKEKHLVTKNSILIDDAPHNILRHIEENNLPGILVDRGYGWSKNTKEDSLIHRLSNFNDIEKKITEIISSY